MAETKQEPTIRVAISDDRAVVRAGLRAIIAEEPHLEAAEACRPAETLFTCAERLHCNVAVIGAAIIDAGTIELVRGARDSGSDVRLLVLTPKIDAALAMSVLRAGAAGCIPTTADEAEIVEAIKTVAGGGNYVDPSLRQQLIANPGAAALHLSPRELTVLLRIASGVPLREIAAELSLKVTTVATYRARLLKKLNVRHNTDLAVYVSRNDLV